MKKVISILVLMNLIFLSSFCIAGNEVPLTYNILPDIANNYVIDSTTTKTISFSLFENETDLYCDNMPLEIVDNKFSISIDNLNGLNEFVFTNSLGETCKYNYYISDENGYLEGYTLNELGAMPHEVYIKTICNVPIIYTSEELKILDDVEEIILSLPESMLENLDEIKLIPAKHTSNAAGITKYNKVTFYNLSSYSKTTIKNIVIHEIAHTWAHELTKDKVIDYSYTDYKEAVASDRNFPSKYAKRNVAEDRYNEDFAESVSFFFINETSFTKKYPARAEYIKELLEIDFNK